MAAAPGGGGEEGAAAGASTAPSATGSSAGCQGRSRSFYGRLHEGQTTSLESRGAGRRQAREGGRNPA